MMVKWKCLSQSKNAVIICSHSCHSKPELLYFFYETPNRISVFLFFFLFRESQCSPMLFWTLLIFTV